ncbi:MAG: D-2-hydroxyacid dehydrogenase family protein [Pseudooceanicola sp.]|nr:D-2-hydroxyacid dehydrogenase family protein [Pseudooceanicola sp.]
MRVAVLDDYQGVALEMADWSPVTRDCEVVVFREPLGDTAAVIAALQGFQIVFLMRERTPFPAAVIDALPALRLIVTTGMRNAAIDIAAAQARGVTVCGTNSTGTPTAELVFAHMLEFNRRVGFENARMKAGEPWQITVGIDLEGKVLGVLGLGKLGRRVAAIGAAFGMEVIAWSQNLTPEACAAAAVRHVGKDQLFAQSDYLSIHVQLSDRTRALIGAAELAAMKPGALLINTSRGPIVDEAALIAALEGGRIHAALDVFDVEPLPRDHPYRRLDNAQISPHLGYVTEGNYRQNYPQVVEGIRAFLDGAPIRVMG